MESVRESPGGAERSDTRIAAERRGPGNVRDNGDRRLSPGAAVCWSLCTARRLLAVNFDA